MKKQIIMLGIVVMLLVVGFSGCEESVDDSSKFIGTWRDNEQEGHFSPFSQIILMLLQ